MRCEPSSGSGRRRHLGSRRDQRAVGIAAGQFQHLRARGRKHDGHAVGRVRQAPRWIQRSGLEWLYRLISEPRRLARRYLVNNPLFVWRISGQIFGWKKYPLEAGDSLEKVTPLKDF